MVVFIYKLMCW